MLDCRGIQRRKGRARQRPWQSLAPCTGRLSFLSPAVVIGCLVASVVAVVQAQGLSYQQQQQQQDGKVIHPPPEIMYPYTAAYERFTTTPPEYALQAKPLLQALAAQQGQEKQNDKSVRRSMMDLGMILAFDIGNWRVHFRKDIVNGEKFLLMQPYAGTRKRYRLIQTHSDNERDNERDNDEEEYWNYDEPFYARVSLEMDPQKEVNTADAMTAAVHYLRTHDLLDAATAQRWAGLEREYLQRKVLVEFYHAVRANETDRLSLTATEGGNWLTQEPVCTWIGVSCGALPSKALPPMLSPKQRGQGPQVLEPLPSEAITAIQLPSLGLTGSLPSCLGKLEYLAKIRLDHNQLQGTLPKEWANVTSLRYMDVSHNQLTGSIPPQFGQELKNLQYINLQHNNITGNLPSNVSAWRDSLQYMHGAENWLTGSIPETWATLGNLRLLTLDDNVLTGHIPTRLGQETTHLRHLDLASNVLSGSIPSGLAKCTQLEQVAVGNNVLTGTFPAELLQSTKLQTLILSDNQMRGTLPATDDWAKMTELGVLYLQDNEFTGSLPTEMFQESEREMRLLDVSRNRLTGTIPTQVGRMSGLHLIHAAGNRLVGTIPTEMTRLHKNLRLNFTNNLITGEIPSLFCGQGSTTLSLLYHDFGCDAVLCPAGTFNLFGHATLHSGCRACPSIPVGEEKALGRISCEGLTNIHGDLDSDGVVSPREVLRLLFIVTIGRFWGQRFQTWALVDVNECDLEGVTCSRGAVAKIDLSGAELCSTGDRQAGSKEFCLGLPSELGLLTGLEILQLSRQRFLRGSIPSEIGLLTKLRHLDISSNVLMSGDFPTEIGRLSSLQQLLVSFCTFDGTIPSEIYALTRLEKLHLTDNDFKGSIPEEIHLSSLQEFMVSRNQLTGTVPTTVGHMTKLENFEVYGNRLTGSIPSEIGQCSNLKRIDFFNNHMTGTVPTELASLRSLQIVHGKLNSLSGTIPTEFGSLPHLSWVDFSSNYLHGTIPSELGGSTSIRDFRVADNMLHMPVPEAFCFNEHVNGGATEEYGCDGVVCPIGYYSETGYATEASNGCTPCPRGKSTVYIGSTSCRTFDDTDLLTIINAVMEGIPWPVGYVQSWTKENENGVCQWEGVECDFNGEIASLTIPIPFDEYS